MSDASFTTQQRKRRALFADRTVQKAAFDNAIKNHILLEGGHNLSAMTYTPHYYDMLNGAVQTTEQERQSYVDSVTLNPSNSVLVNTVPDPPTSVSAVGGNAEATVSFTTPLNNGGFAISLYTVISSPGGFTATGTSSPILVPYLSNNTSYTFTVVATNSIGDSGSSSASNSITTSTPSSSAPTITGINTLPTSFIVTFNAPASFGTITNYEYSLNGGTSFTALSPVDALSPITISSLTPTTTYTVAIRAVNNVPATGDRSNIISVATTTTLITETFSTPISTSWIAPANVRYVQYLCVAGGGGGGAAYSKINVLGTVPVQSTAPASGYWIYNGVTTANYTNGRMYNGAAVNPNYTTFADPIRCTASADLQPTGTSSSFQKWYALEYVYDLSQALPNMTNTGYFFQPNSTINNKISGGGGGGAGGQVVASFIHPNYYYPVTPRRTYSVIVGDGGEGGVGGSNSEAVGSPGGDSRFDVYVASGGSGGRASRDRNTGNIQNGYNNGGKGQTTVGLQIGGFGGQGAGGSGAAGTYNTGGFGGAASGVSPIDSGSYGSGGSSGVPDTVATGLTAPNVGKGGAGTGAVINSYASGIKGGTGVVLIKYYI